MEPGRQPLHTITGLLPSEKGNCKWRDRILPKSACSQNYVHGSRTRTGRTSCICRSERIPESGNGYTQEKTKRRIEQTLARVYERFPSFERKKRPESRNTLRWRAADAGNGTALMSKTETDRHGRASMGLSPIFCKQIFDIIKEVRKREHDSISQSRMRRKFLWKSQTAPMY